MMTRRTLVLGTAAAAGLALAGCAGSNAPPTRWYVLRDELPEGVAGTAAVAAATREVEATVAAAMAPMAATRPGGTATAATAADAVWEVAPGLRIPSGLDRDTLVVAAGTAGLEPLTGHRWAEPLRDSLPRVLVADLARLRGPGRVWAAPAPTGVVATRRLRVDLQTLLATADRRNVRVRAQWWLLDAAAVDAAPPQAGSADFEVAVDGGSVDALASAHRLALWRLAERIVAGR